MPTPVTPFVAALHGGPRLAAVENPQAPRAAKAHIDREERGQRYGVVDVEVSSANDHRVRDRSF